MKKFMLLSLFMVLVLAGFGASPKLVLNGPGSGEGFCLATRESAVDLLVDSKDRNTLQLHTTPFNCYDENKVVADEYGIVMGASHIEPMLRNNMRGAEWDREYPDEPWDYIKNRDHIYEYWEKIIKENGKYDNIYTVGKRGKDDQSGSDIIFNG